MKRLLLILALPLVASGQPFTFGDPVFVANLNPAPSSQVFLINQTFEGTGYDNGETWTEIGNPDEDYTATVLSGAQSLFVDGTAADKIAASPQFTQTSDVYIKAKFRFTSIPSATRRFADFVSDGVGTVQFRLEIFSTGELRINSDIGGTDPNTVATVSVDTTYWLWIRYTAGGGTDGFCSVAFSTTESKPTSGDNFASTTNWQNTVGLTGLRCFSDFSGATGSAVIWDNIQVSATEILP